MAKRRFEAALEGYIVTKTRPVRIVGAAIGQGAQDRGCASGPQALRSAGLLPRLQASGVNAEWETTLQTEQATAPLAAVRGLSKRLSQRVKGIVQAGELPLVIGGDHSCAIGTWSGVAAAIAPQGSLGLLWIDAHMDAHVPATSPSGALHGMPLACLLGYGETSLVSVASGGCLHPENVCLVGVRSFESGEAELLTRLGVRIFFMEEVRRRGLTTVLDEAHSIVGRITAGFGITLDVDALDPRDAPGVGSPVPGGLRPDALLRSLTPLAADERFLGFEVAEYNPFHDTEGRTAAAVSKLAGGLLLHATLDCATMVDAL
jgi:arginase